MISRIILEAEIDTRLINLVETLRYEYPVEVFSQPLNTNVSEIHIAGLVEPLRR